MNQNNATADQYEQMTANGARASIHYGRRGGQWAAEFRFVLVSLGRASTMPLTDRSARFASRAAALADVAERIVGAVDAAVAGLALTPAQERAAKAVREWAQVQAHAAKPRFLDCFAGVGGFHAALAGHGAVCAGAIELDAAARDTYRANHPGAYPVHDDIRTACAAAFGRVDVLCAGFPCQSFSQAGGGAGLDATDKGALFFEAARLIAELSPTVALLENVPALVGHDDGRTLDTILGTLTRLGYAVSTALLDAGQFGLAQVRERLFFVCIHDRALTERVAPYSFPTGTDAAVVVNDILDGASSVPPCPRQMVRIRPEPTKRSQSIELVGHIEGRRSQGYRVASPMGKGYTLCANSGGAGGKTGLYQVRGKPRPLSPREAARMQGFPDSFKPHATRSTALRQFGNSVAVPVVSAVFGTLSPSLF